MVLIFRIIYRLEQLYSGSNKDPWDKNTGMDIKEQFSRYSAGGLFINRWRYGLYYSFSLWMFKIENY